MDAAALLERAFKYLGRAEESSGGEALAWSVEAVEHAALAVSALNGSGGGDPRAALLETMPRVSTRLWGEVLRLAELVTWVGKAEPEDAVEMAREAVEIAAALFLAPKEPAEHG